VPPATARDEPRLEATDAADGGGLPGFIEREFREFLTCGALTRGFARVRCEDCAFERLVAFSCSPEDPGFPDVCTAISLDASSSLNRFRNLKVEAKPTGSVAVSDAGTGNCGDNITYL